MNVPAAVREFLNKHRVEGVGVVAVSGGPDSVALLSALQEVYSDRLIVAHVNHQLRGDESNEDEGFVCDLADKFGFEFCTVELPVPSTENLESAARRLRYDWFEMIARLQNQSWIATGHTADDQAETVLHRLIRGTGLQGLRGIAKTKFSGNAEALRSGARADATANALRSEDSASPLNIIRPLINVSRSDVIAYLQSINQSARIDSSNSDHRFTRNRIRHELLPSLKTYNPEIVAVLNRVADHAAEAFEFIEHAARELLQRAERPRAGERLIFDKPTLETASPFLVRELFRLVWRREAWPQDAMSAAHWQRAATLTAADYPDGIKFRLVGRVVQIHRGERGERGEKSQN